MTHIVINCEQGSLEWHRARAGVITASMFSTIRGKVNCLDDKQSAYVQAILAGKSEASAREIAGYKTAPRAEGIRKALDGEPVGDWSDTAKNYAFRLAVERISGEPLDEGFQTWSMKRGHELEPMARMEHELQSGLVVQRAGFVVTDDGAFGASADGLIEEDEGSEYKCFIDPEKLRAFWVDNDPSSVMEQAQGCMWLTGRKRWHIGLYCPALEPAKKQLWWRVFERDDDHIEKMERDLLDFKSIVDGYEELLRKEAA
ncbi:MAG: lambda exonuclease family protein [Alcaligenes pakistanensis]